jgi:hypothetical protein
VFHSQLDKKRLTEASAEFHDLTSKTTLCLVYLADMVEIWTETATDEEKGELFADTCKAIMDATGFDAKTETYDQDAFIKGFNKVSDLKLVRTTESGS